MQFWFDYLTLNHTELPKITFAVSCMLMLFYIILTATFLRQLLGLDARGRVKKRLSQLDQTKVVSLTDSEKNKQQLNALTEPVIRYVFPRVKPRSLNEIDKNLKLLGWHRQFSADQWVALNWFGKVVGIAFLLLIGPFDMVIAVIMAIMPLALMDLLYFTQLKEKKDALLVEFPDFVEILDGYISAGYDFIRASEAAMTATVHWQPFLREFLAVAQYENLQTGLAYLKSAVPLFEVESFLCILELGMEQGIDMEENIRHQIDRIRDLQKLAFNKKIVSRQVMAIGVNGPLLITVLVAFALPTVEQVMQM